MWQFIQGVICVLLVTGCGQHYQEGAHPPPKPPPQAQLPADHPPLDGAPAASPQLPPDHPPLEQASGTSAQLPPGHPPLESTSLPAELPPIEGTSPPPVARPVDDQAAFSGTIRIADHLVNRLPERATLFIIARPAPTGGPPLMVKRLPMPVFPFAYSLTEMDGMMPGQPVDFSDVGALYLTVRIDLDGSVGPPQPGDMEGTAAQNPVPVGSRDADIVIDRIY